MATQSATISNNLENLTRLPGGVTSGRAEALETVAFRSGAAMVVLDQLVSDPKHGVSVELLANRLALSAATLKLKGRLAREADIRDALHLTPRGGSARPGWQKASGSGNLAPYTEMAGAKGQNVQVILVPK